MPPLTSNGSGIFYPAMNQGPKMQYFPTRPGDYKAGAIGEDATFEKNPSQKKYSLLVDYSKSRDKAISSSSIIVLRKHQSCRNLGSSGARALPVEPGKVRSQTLSSLSDHSRSTTSSQSIANATFSVSFRIRKRPSDSTNSAAKNLHNATRRSSYQKLQKSLRDLKPEEEEATPLTDDNALKHSPPPPLGDRRSRFAQTKHRAVPDGPQGTSRPTCLAQGRSPSSRVLLDSLLEPEDAQPAPLKPIVLHKSLRNLASLAIKADEPQGGKEDNIAVFGHNSFTALNAVDRRAPRRRSKRRSSFIVEDLLATCDGVRLANDNSHFVAFTGSRIRRNGGSSALMRNATR